MNSKGLNTITALININIGDGGKGFGIILQKNEDTYRLHPCLVKKFKEYF
jgi:hypothetical protein